LTLNGYRGKILRVDLTNKEISTESLTEEEAKKWLGGVGLASKIIYEEVPSDSDPLGPENVFVFATGPFQDTSILGSGRFAAAAQSPLTGIWGESMGGGYNGTELKKAGFDAIVCTGKSEEPVYLWVKNGEAELREAKHLWGKDAYETEDAIKEELEDEDVQVAPIGPAAENLVRYAGLICNYGHGCAGRMGMGAVMGSKNLKAIALRGTMDPPEVANPEKLNELKKELTKKASEADFTQDNREYGQAMAVIPREENGLLPIKNFKQARWPDGAQEIGSAADGKFDEKLKPEPEPCSYCIMGCHRRVKVDDPEEYAMDSYGPEYETLGMIGSDCLIDNLYAINKANELCNRYSIDTIEFGAICAFAMELYEQGKIDEDDLGFALEWGDGDAMLKLLEKIKERDGEISEILGEGLRPAGEKFDAEDIALHVKGAAVPAHDPRAFFSMAVETATSTRGACHLHGFPEAIEIGVPFPEAGEELSEPLDRFDKEKKGLAASKYQDRMAVANSLDYCFFYEFSGYTFSDVTDIVNATTGWDLTPSELLETGERIVNMQRMFNLTHGMDPQKDEKLPERLKQPLSDGGAEGKVPPLEEMLEEYYSVKDWPQGIPSEEKLKELGLESAVEDLPA